MTLLLTRRYYIWTAAISRVAQLPVTLAARYVDNPQNRCRSHRLWA